MEELFTVLVPYPRLSGKKKNQLCTMNNLPSWYRFQKTKIKNSFKNLLQEWYLPESGEPMTECVVTVQAVRHNGRKLDADASAFIAKWFIDALTESGFLHDDDKVELHLLPLVRDTSLPETMLKFKVYERTNENERY